MNNKIGSALLVFALAAVVALPNGANAQTTSTSTTSGTGSTVTTQTTTSAGSNTYTMPVLYNQVGGTAMNNTGSASLAAGWYYTANGTQVYYYGNGTYYDPSTGTYGGHISNTNGTAGTFSLPAGSAGVGTGTTGTTGTSGTIGSAPGVPNTGAGGESALNWFLLLASGTIAVAGSLYLTKRIAFS